MAVTADQPLISCTVSTPSPYSSAPSLKVSICCVPPASRSRRPVGTMAEEALAACAGIEELWLKRPPLQSLSGTVRWSYRRRGFDTLPARRALTLERAPGTFRQYVTSEVKLAARSQSPTERHGLRQWVPAGLPGPTDWWRRRELNPRPQVLDFRIYARSPFFVSHPTLPEGQGRRQTS